MLQKKPDKRITAKEILDALEKESKRLEELSKHVNEETLLLNPIPTPSDQLKNKPESASVGKNDSKNVGETTR